LLAAQAVQKAYLPHTFRTKNTLTMIAKFYMENYLALNQSWPDIRIFKTPLPTAMQ